MPFHGQRLTLAMIVGFVSGFACAGVHIEVAQVWRGPDGQDNHDIMMYDPALLAVWIWADEPGVQIHWLSFDVIGVSSPASPSLGGYEFTGVGTADPSHLFLDRSNGTWVYPSLIRDVWMFALPVPIYAVTLPTDMSEALLVYGDFTGEAVSQGGGVRVANVLINGPDGPIEDISVYGLYQTPTPGICGVFLAAGLMCARRRREAIS